MSDLINLIQEADLLMLDWENSKTELESAKLQLELAKEKLDSSRQKFESVVSQADQFGIPRAKLRKLVEERSQSLVASGLFSTPANAAPTKSSSPKPPKAVKKSKAVSENQVIEDKDLDTDFMNIDEGSTEASV